MKGRQGIRCKQLLDELKEVIDYWQLKDEALDRTVWGNGCGRGMAVGRHKVLCLALNTGVMASNGKVLAETQHSSSVSVGGTSFLMLLWKSGRKAYEIRKSMSVLNTMALFGVNRVVEQNIETKVLMERTVYIYIYILNELINYLSQATELLACFRIQLHKNHCDSPYDMFCLWQFTVVYSHHLSHHNRLSVNY